MKRIISIIMLLVIAAVSVAAGEAAEIGAYLGVWSLYEMKTAEGSLLAEDYGIYMVMNINADGTAQMTDDISVEEAAWSFSDGNLYVDEIVFTMNEDGNLEADFDGDTMVFAPAAEEAFFGVWKGSYIIMDGEQTDLADYGLEMTLTVSPDGTAVMNDGISDGEAAEWSYTDGVLTIAETTMTIDDNGELIMDDGSMHMYFERGSAFEEEYYGDYDWEYSEDEEYETPDVTGIWYNEANGCEFTVYANGTAVAAYSDGTTAEMEWESWSGIPTITTGDWWCASMTIMEDGTLNVCDGIIDDYYVYMDAAPYVETVEVDNTAVIEAVTGEWFGESNGYTVTISEDGSIVAIDADGYTWEMEWEFRNGVPTITTGIWWDGVMTVGDDGRLNINDGYVDDYYCPADGTNTAVETTDVEVNAEELYIDENAPAEMADFCGVWACSELEFDGEVYEASMFGMEGFILTLNEDGTCSVDEYGEITEGSWYVVDGAAYVDDGTMLYMADDGRLYYEDGADRMYFSRPGSETADTDDVGYEGQWTCIYMSAGMLVGDPIDVLGYTGMLELTADGTATSDFPNEVFGVWYEDEYGNAYICTDGATEMPLILYEGGFIQMGTEASGYMVYSKYAFDIWDPENVPAVISGAADAGESAVSGDVSAPAAGGKMEQKFVCETYTTYGRTFDASTLGAEYSLLFHENGTVDFVMAGVEVKGLSWTYGTVTLESGEAEAYMIDYYGTAMGAVPTETGYDLDFYGTMTMHFVPAE